jgi:hypothetical protein
MPPINLKMLCTDKGDKREIHSKKARVVRVLEFRPVSDPLFDKGQFLDLTGKSKLKLVTPELSAGDTFCVGQEYIITISEDKMVGPAKGSPNKK